MITGVIARINYSRGLIAIRTINDDYSVIELLSEEDIELDDPVAWQNKTGLGNQEIFNLRNGKQFVVFFQNHHVTYDNIVDQV